MRALSRTESKRCGAAACTHPTAQVLQALAPFHCWTEGLLETRFKCGYVIKSLAWPHYAPPRMPHGGRTFFLLSSAHLALDTSHRRVPSLSSCHLLARVMLTMQWSREPRKPEP